jgi:hypothetical protein
VPGLVGHKFARRRHAIFVTAGRTDEPPLKGAVK